MISLWKLLFFLLVPFSVYSASLKERFYKAKPGDYVVTLQNQHYSFLKVHDLKGNLLVLEEITVPEDEYKQKSWKQWIDQNAPGHTSWIQYEIDLEKNKLLKCYSKRKMASIYPEEADYLFLKFLTLPLRVLKETERKKIGPPPQDGEADRRKLWNPTLTIEGKTIPKAQFDVVQGEWPKDDSQLSQCLIDFYLDPSRPFPFPYWIDIKSSHYEFKIRVIDSGSYEQSSRGD